MKLELKDVDVSDDYLILSAVLDEYGITVKQLASLTGRAGSTIYKYLAGEATIPSVVWRAVYAKTRDYRILQLIIGDMAIAVVATDDIPDAEDQAASLDMLLTERQAQLQCEQLVLNILADGKVDRSDRAMIEEYKLKHPRMIETQHRLFQAIMNTYNNSALGEMPCRRRKASV